MDYFENVLERVPDWFLLGFHSPRSLMFVVGLMLVAGLVIVVVLRGRRPELVPALNRLVDGIGDRDSVKPRPLLDDPEVSMFNLLLLAVRDHFLLLSKIPLRSLVHLQVEDDSFRRVLAQTLRNVTVDFVVVHPGSRLPVKVIFVRKPRDDALASSSQERLVDVLLYQAGIDVIRLDQEVRYSVERLTNLLGLEEES